MIIVIILVVVLLIFFINRSFSIRKFPLPQLKEQFTITEKDKSAYIQDLFPTIKIPEHEFPTLINKLNSLRFVTGMTNDKIREQLKPLLLDYLIPDYYAIRYRDPGQINEEQSGKKHNYAYIFREDNVSESRTEAKKHFERSKQYELTQLMIGPKNRKMGYEIQLVYVETKNGIIINEVVEDKLNEWSLSF